MDTLQEIKALADRIEKRFGEGTAKQITLVYAAQSKRNADPTYQPSSEELKAIDWYLVKQAQLRGESVKVKPV